MKKLGDITSRKANIDEISETADLRAAETLARSRISFK